MVKLKYLNPDEQKALDEFLSELFTNFEGQVDSLCLFGSKARGESTEESDIDLLIIFKNIHNKREIIRWLSEVESEINMKYGVLISSYPIDRNYYESHKYFSFLRNIEAEGIPL
ncbi:MAG: nucleotidyltransferase domain-containing protein [bacterium]